MELVLIIAVLVLVAIVAALVEIFSDTTTTDETLAIRYRDHSNQEK